jgi:hypothetical protein
MGGKYVLKNFTYLTAFLDDPPPTFLENEILISGWIFEYFRPKDFSPLQIQIGLVCLLSIPMQI